MAKTAWMANKWGGSAWTAPTPAIGEAECGICMHSAVQISFIPCKHGSCLPCIERLRAGNVFKVNQRTNIWDELPPAQQCTTLLLRFGLLTDCQNQSSLSRRTLASDVTSAANMWKATNPWIPGVCPRRKTSSLSLLLLFVTGLTLCFDLGSAARQCREQVNQFLVGANKAANAAAQARKPAPRKPGPVRTAACPEHLPVLLVGFLHVCISSNMYL